MLRRGTYQVCVRTHDVVRRRAPRQSSGRGRRALPQEGVAGRSAVRHVADFDYVRPWMGDFVAMPRHVQDLICLL